MPRYHEPLTSKATEFLFIGAARAATTVLSRPFRPHPPAEIAKEKEPHFFSLKEYYELGWDHHHELYRYGAEKIIVRDSSTPRSS